MFITLLNIYEIKLSGNSQRSFSKLGANHSLLDNFTLTLFLVKSKFEYLFHQSTYMKYSFVPNCRGGAVQFKSFGKKPTQLHLIIIRQWPKNNHPTFRNLDSFPLVHFIRLPPMIRHKRVWEYKKAYAKIFKKLSELSSGLEHFKNPQQTKKYIF